MDSAIKVTAEFALTNAYHDLIRIVKYIFSCQPSKNKLSHTFCKLCLFCKLFLHSPDFRLSVMSVVSRESFSLFFFFHLMYCLVTSWTEDIVKWYDKILFVDNVFQTTLHEILSTEHKYKNNGDLHKCCLSFVYRCILAKRTLFYFILNLSLFLHLQITRGAI